MPGKPLSHELKEHMPFTMLGAASGIILMLIFSSLVEVEGHALFKVFHPLHVVLSAYATTLLYRRRSPGSSVIKVIIIGYVGSLGVATISDSIIPYCGERIMGISVPTHDHSEHSHCEDPEHLHNSSLEEAEQEKTEQVVDEYTTGATPKAGQSEQAAATTEELVAPSESQNKTIEPEHDKHHLRHLPGKPDVHIGFIEDWAIVNLAAVVGIIMGFLLNAGKMPHTTHVLISTWASMAHIMMNTANTLTPINYIGIFIVLFLAVWLPCCLSDIVFPTLFSLKNME